MRRGFLLATLGVGTVLLIALILLAPSGPRTSKTEPGEEVPAGEVQPAAVQSQQDINLANRPESPLVQPAGTAPFAPRTSPALDSNEGDREEKREAYVAARTAELHNLSGKTDPASLQILLSEVRNPDVEIRQAALDAISQSGNRGAIPGLLEAASQTEDATAKQAIVETVEFLKLPTLTERLRGNPH